MQLKDVEVCRRSHEMTDYFMDDPREAKRLIDKVNARGWCARYLAHNLVGRKSFLEVGCGPGHLLAEVRRTNPGLILYGVDVSQERLALARQAIPEVEEAFLYVADIESLPLRNGLVQCTLTRFLLEYVPDKQKAVNELARVTSSGGTVILQDLDAQFFSYYPTDEDVNTEITGIVRALAATGFDPNVGRKLFTYAYRAGLENIDVKVAPYHLYQGTISDDQLALWTLKLDIAAQAMAEKSGRSLAAIRTTTDRYLALLKRPEDFFYSLLVTVVARKGE
jgi:ubiquinone/menaquinone biosynthesis C-methylase UbiE